MKRRNFMRIAGISASLPFMIKGVPLYAKKQPLLDRILSGDDINDRILILIQLNGGNDGLNTVIPLDKLSELNKVRSQVILPENSLLKISDEVGLHPSMTGLNELWQDEKFEIVQNVGYPGQNFSHFRSTDIWTSASDADKYVGSGWIGRYLAEDHPDFPDEYPNDEYTDPLSITVGPLVSQTCQGPVFSMGLAVKDLESFYNINNKDYQNELDDYAASELDFINTIVRQTKSYMTVLESAGERGKLNDSLWENDGVNRLADQMKVIAKLLNGGLKTKIYVCSITGFDTHAAQVDQSDHTNGAHALLLRNLSNAINSFQKQIEEYGIEDKVLGMTFSEFGRRIIANDSFGTDHGAAAPHLFFGSKVNPVVHGNNPEIPTDAGPKDNLKEEYDFRSLYWSVLKDWFEVSDEKLLRIMFKEFEHVQILKPSGTSVESSNDFKYDLKALNVYPNPAHNYSNIAFYTKGSYVRIDIVDMQGREIKNIYSGNLNRGRHEIRFDCGSISSGNYLIKLRNSFSIENIKLKVVK